MDNNAGARGVFATLADMFTVIKRALGKLARQDEGDVPGWVLITLMTAGLVIVIWGLAGPALSNVFQQAIDRVTGF